ncbi:helix-turn-helix domain-containing protein [Halobacteriovorax sp. GB3]|uniref:helix-turn-helix domain-containing protein n=1 Tax=Halobacteriovorax sp. GB3 TaxID=2719615 RepID=UPI00235EDDC1|nr:helix-turn-helix domain-containing protein [Halobacteriovorax sp. GB3]MDD0853018.1 helix-turn-helix domain-containing protein [Halobacteriovorax sp. GB3]
MNVKKTFSRNLKALRKGKFTQASLAEACDVSHSTIRSYENCVSFPSAEILESLSSILEVPVAKLLDSDDFREKRNEAVHASNSISSVDIQELILPNYLRELSNALEVEQRIAELVDLALRDPHAIDPDDEDEMFSYLTRNETLNNRARIIALENMYTKAGKFFVRAHWARDDDPVNVSKEVKAKSKASGD